LAQRSGPMSVLNAARGAFGWRAAQQVGVQAIYFIRLLILARLLVPEAFGQLAIAMLIVSTLMSLSDLGVVQALVQRERIDRDDYDAAWTVGVTRALLIAGVMIASAPVLATLFGDPRTTPVIQALGLRPVLAALGSIGVVRLTRELRFRELAMIQVPGALVDLGVAVALAPMLGVWALVLGLLTGTASITLLSYVIAPHRPRLLLRPDAALPLIHFGRWVLGTSIIGLIASSGVQLVISRRLGVGELGLYFLATKVAFLPAEAASTVFDSVAFPLYASLQRDDGRTSATLRALLSLLAFLLFPVYALMIALAPSLAEALGPRWTGTAPIIQLLALAAALGVYADATLPLHMGRGRPDRAMIVVAMQTGVLLLLMLPFVSAFGAPGAAAAWIPAYAAAQLTSLLFVQRMIGPPVAGAGHQLMAVLGVSTAAAIAAAVARMWLNGPAALVAGLLLGVVTGTILLLALSRRMEFDVRVFFRAPAAQVAS